MYHKMHSLLTHKIHTAVGVLVLAAALMLSLAAVAAAKKQVDRFSDKLSEHLPEEAR